MNIVKHLIVPVMAITMAISTHVFAVQSHQQVVAAHNNVQVANNQSQGEIADLIKLLGQLNQIVPNNNPVLAETQVSLAALINNKVNMLDTNDKNKKYWNSVRIWTRRAVMISVLLIVATLSVDKLAAWYFGEKSILFGLYTLGTVSKAALTALSIATKGAFDYIINPILSFLNAQLAFVGQKLAEYYGFIGTKIGALGASLGGIWNTCNGYATSLFNKVAGFCTNQLVAIEKMFEYLINKFYMLVNGGKIIVHGVCDFAGRTFDVMDCVFEKTMYKFGHVRLSRAAEFTPSAWSSVKSIFTLGNKGYFTQAEGLKNFFDNRICY